MIQKVTQINEDFIPSWLKQKLFNSNQRLNSIYVSLQSGGLNKESLLAIPRTPYGLPDAMINIKSKEEPGCSENPAETEPNRRGFAKA